MTTDNHTDNLYAINDALTELLQRFRVEFDTDELRDDALQDATMAVAAIFWPGGDEATTTCAYCHARLTRDGDGWWRDETPDPGDGRGGDADCGVLIHLVEQNGGVVAAQAHRPRWS